MTGWKSNIISRWQGLHSFRLVGHKRHGQFPSQPAADFSIRTRAHLLRGDDSMPQEEVDHDGTHIRLELAGFHLRDDLVGTHELKPVHLVVPRGGQDVRGHLHIVHVQDLGVIQARDRVDVGHGQDAGWPALGGYEGRGQRGLLAGLGEDTGGRGVGSLDAAGDGAVEHARVGGEMAAALGDPDAEAASLVREAPDEGGHVGAAGGGTEEGGREALNVDGAGTTGARDEEGLAVLGAEVGEDVCVDGGVDGLLDGAVDVLRAGGWRGGWG